MFGQTLSYALASIYHLLASNPALVAIGAYGLAIIVVTLLVRLVLAPLFQLQLVLSRRSMQQQKKLAPQMAELRKKYKNDPQKQQAAMMELYREHGVNPLSSLSGCLPALLQFPILSALYYVFWSNAHNNTFADHFLFVPHLNDTPSSHALIPGLPIPTLVYLVIPVLAAATTFIQSRMMQQPVSATPTEQEQQQQQMARTMQVMMPLMIGYFAFVTPAGLGLYWLVSNCVSIVQQYFVTGWGGLRRQPAAAGAGAAAAVVSTSKGSGGGGGGSSQPAPKPPKPASQVATPSEGGRSANNGAGGGGGRRQPARTQGQRRRRPQQRRSG